MTTETRAHWSALSPGQELDSLVAERYGWTCAKVTWTPASKADRGWMYLVKSPEGREVHGGAGTVEEAWEMAHRIDTHWACVPHYSTDVNAALSLLGPKCDFRLSCVASYWNATIYDQNNNQNATEYAHTPALAVCRAWLRWHDAR